MKSLTEMRATALAVGVKFTFADKKEELMRKIELAKDRAAPKIPQLPTLPPYDSRMMTRPPSKSMTEKDARELLAPFIEVGLHLTFPEPERWKMIFGKKSDEGTLRMPLRVLFGCAERIMR